MANELLDFVMSLVRDPDAAARYAENPQQAIADAHLTDVTSVDVNNLIPVVSESMSMAAPAFGSESATDANVWASGAATAAFDAFSEPVPAPLDADQVVDTDQVVEPPTVAMLEPSADLPTFDPVSAFDQPFNAPEVEVHDVAPTAEPAAFDADDPGFDFDPHF